MRPCPGRPRAPSTYSGTRPSHTTPTRASRGPRGPSETRKSSGRRQRGLHRVWGLGHPVPRPAAAGRRSSVPNLAARHDPAPSEGPLRGDGAAAAAAPQTRAEPVSAPHDVPHLTTSEPDTRSSVVRPPEHARADDAAVPTGAGGRPRAPPLPRRRGVSYAPPPRDRAMVRRGPPPCDARAASPLRGRRIGLRSLGHFGASVRRVSALSSHSLHGGTVSGRGEPTPRASAALDAVAVFVHRAQIPRRALNA